ncbi:hypothetical protein CP488_00462 [Chthonomonas calidirosea]|nr:hypothetical protein CP488_00462 [Chthonomonas calidirosea]
MNVQGTLRRKFSEAFMYLDTISYLLPIERKRVVVWLAFWLLLALHQCCRATPRVVLLVVPDLTCADLTTLPLRSSIEEFSSQGALGWMVCRAASNVPRSLLTAEGTDRLTSLLLSLGAGTRAVAPPDSFLAVYPPVPLGTGGSTLNVALLRRCYALNRRLEYPVDIGLLGTLVHRSGGATAAIADADNGFRANAALLVAMDAEGHVDFAGPRLFCAKGNLLAPEGAEADVEKMLSAFNQLPIKTRLTVISFFDLQRATEEATACLPAMAALYRQEALGRLTKLMQGIVEWLRGEPDVTLWCCAPGPGTYVTTDERLAPVLLMGKGIPKKGTIFAPSTRWDGLGLNSDLLPTIAQQLNLPNVPRSVVGRTWKFKEKGSVSLQSFCAYFRQLVTHAELQNLYGGLPILQLFCILGGVVCWRRRMLPPSVFGLMIGLLPALLLVLPALFTFNALIAGIALGISLMVIAAAAEWMSRTQRDAVAVLRTAAAVFVGCVVVDLLTGSHLMRQAWMSYSIMEGARFFGIGNEYMGALFGAALLLLPWLINEKGNWRLAVIIYFGIVFVTVWPQWGAKVGAIPTGVGAFGLALFAAIRQRISWKEFAWLCAFALLLFGGVAFVDLHFHGANESHLARALKGEGGGSLIVVVLRKLRMEEFLLFHSPWTAVLLGSLIAIGYFHRVQNANLGVVERAMWLGFYGGVVCALLFNDAGVPAAALLAQQGLGLALCEGAKQTDRLSEGIS